ncbi:MHYT domain-containing protein [Streptomyces sp. NRRL WC-3549]|uniref:MHYT domain-containing protein n=1 Tax=Streptomyces sp. NRRL WC-3549 TaxID=1463925 RepID=UPI0004C81045|nr:MHYT domain-containing protein [Streptomyces sp. NRRL WC-3549]
MQGTVDGFSYGLVTPVAAFLMACLGAALGLRCTMRSLHARGGARAGWLTLGATSIGSGVWTMHFVAMLGFTVAKTPVGYDRALTFAGLGVAVVMVGVGIFIVGYRGATRMALVTGGTVTGLGVASMHYLGMAGVLFEGSFSYDTLTVSLSVVIAVVAATAALWAAVSVHGFLPSLGASVVMAVAVSGMHYTGMAALHVHLDPAALPAAGDEPAALLLPMLVGPGCFLLLAGVVVLVDPLVVTGGRPSAADHRHGPSPYGGRTALAIPVQRRRAPRETASQGGRRQPRSQ